MSLIFAQLILSCLFLARVGRLEIADPTTVFEPSGHVIAHHCCAAWSSGVAPRTSNIKSASSSPFQYSDGGRSTHIILGNF